MNKRRFLKVGALILVFAGMTAPPFTAAPRLRIAASIFPLKEFAAAVAGENAVVDMLLPPGAGVHTWQPTAGDILKIGKADLVVCAGAGLEPWLDDILKSVGAGGPDVLVAARDLPLVEAGGGEGHGHEGHGRADPHFWLDFEIDQGIIERIVEALTRLDPGGGPAYRYNGDAYKARLRELDRKFKEGLKSCAGRTVVIAGHAAFGYLARKYDLRQVALYGLSPDSQPTPRRTIEVTELARKMGVRTIFFENSVPRDLARTVAGEIGARTIGLHAGHNLSRAEMMKAMTFFDIMEINLGNLKNGLDCGS